MEDINREVLTLMFYLTCKKHGRMKQEKDIFLIP